ncbi:MAG: head GIN domain-containing protein [Bacteroidota bacterium]
MKKYIVAIGLFLVFISCEKPSDCVESTGDIITRDFQIDMPTVADSIKRIYVQRGIELIVTEGPIFKVTVETGENLMDNIEVKREGTVLSLKDNTTCNWVREFGQTKVYITTPKLEEIYSKSERNISSNGVLTFPILRLFALDSDGDGIEGAGTGDFFITINNGQLVILNNNVSRYYISGQTGEALLDIYAGDGRIEAQNLTAQHVNVYHRGSNDIIVKPIQTLTGNLYSTGNLISKGHPINNPQVTAHYQGQLIFE